MSDRKATLAAIKSYGPGPAAISPVDAYFRGSREVSTPFARKREDALRIEAALEAELVRKRLEAEQRLREVPVTTLPNDGMSLAQYVQNSRAQHPAIPQMRQALEPNYLGSFPSFSGVLQALGIQGAPDPQVDDRLRGIAGNMALNNQRVRARLDDFERARARAGMARIR
jgi:hypothetical protein